MFTGGGFGGATLIGGAAEAGFPSDSAVSGGELGSRR